MTNEQQDIWAGDFSSWLHQFRNALLTDSGMDLPCGECIACCCGGVQRLRFTETGLSSRATRIVYPTGITSAVSMV